ncbi:MAG: hypothetical protein LBT55_05735 [Clostridiaceae bacterium]|nr:hypothetical protein [Clostridiaceae bacterium]
MLNPSEKHFLNNQIADIVAARRTVQKFVDSGTVGDLVDISKAFSNISRYITDFAEILASIAQNTDSISVLKLVSDATKYPATTTQIISSFCCHVSDGMSSGIQQRQVDFVRYNYRSLCNEALDICDYISHYSDILVTIREQNL